MKKMFVVLAVLILSIGFIGCSSPTDPDNGGGVSIPSQFWGEWEIDNKSADPAEPIILIISETKIREGYDSSYPFDGLIDEWKEPNLISNSGDQTDWKLEAGNYRMTLRFSVRDNIDHIQYFKDEMLGYWQVVCNAGYNKK